MRIGERIKKYRIANNMSIQELAEGIGEVYRSVLRWENTDRVPRLDKLIKIADVFDLSMDELIGRKR